MADGRGGQGPCVRLLHINDVYTLEHLPRIKSLVVSERPDMVTMGGDFLAPYLLSTLDHGRGMVEVLNSLPTTFAILGNHECDVPHEALLSRIDEFAGRFISSNFQVPGAAASSNKLSRAEVVEVGGVKIGLIGLLCNYPELYRPSSFDGKWREIEDPVECATRLVNNNCDEELAACDRLVALTHLDLDDDRELARRCPRLDAILGGHDHQLCSVTEGDVAIVKAGMNATHCAIVDLPLVGDAARPRVRLVEAAAYEAHPDTQRIVDRHMLKLRALDRMALTTSAEVLTTLGIGSDGGGPLSSVGSRRGECTMATLLCSALKWELDCDCAVLEAGSVRGDRVYGDTVTFAHLKQEMPFANATGIAAIDGATLRDMVQESRSKPGPFFLHLDSECRFGSSGNHHHHKLLTEVDGAPLKPGRVYSVAVGLDLGFGSKVNATMLRYRDAFPKRVPSIEAAIEAKTIILAFFAARFWTRLPVFDDIANGDNHITYDDLYQHFVPTFFPSADASPGSRDDGASTPSDDDADADDDAKSASKAAAEQMVRQLIQAFDTDADGRISRAEYEAIFSKYARRRNYSKCAVRRDSCRHFYVRKSESLLLEGDTTP